ncbi:MAG TPA: hypothetical protein VML50_03545 [Anaeromyxobacter sp.]|nr:hypothetical protein [Anaeromyxobacter sp.]
MTPLSRLPISLLAALALAGCDPITTTPPGPSGSASALAAGEAHACGLEANGLLKCWGKGGLVGDGTRALRPTAVGVAGLGPDVVSVVTGEAHSCALTRSGLVYCWGTGTDRGQLGPAAPGSTQPLLETLEPTQIDFGANGGVSAIAAGARHTCAIQPLGDVWCWGDNAQWQVGAGAAAISVVPNAVQGEQGQAAYGIRLVSAGDSHSCVVTGNGEAHCWGANEHGQLGTGAAGGVFNTPQRVQLGAPVTAISGGRAHTCALLVGGTARCWGANASGQLGDDTGVDSATPVSPTLDSGLKVLEVSAGGDSTCAVTDDRFLRCWGDNSRGQLGDGSNLPRFSPVLVRGLTSNIRSVSVGVSSTCAVTLAGKSYCWGHNDQGQLGDGTNTDRSQPVEVQGL